MHMTIFQNGSIADDVAKCDKVRNYWVCQINILLFKCFNCLPNHVNDPGDNSICGNKFFKLKIIEKLF